MSRAILEKAAATKIQRNFKLFNARKKYTLSLLPIEKTQNGPVYCVGNEPDLYVPAYLKADSAFVLVGTSGLHMLKIAAKFCADDTTFIPKLIVVDINPKVKIFWQQIQLIFKENTSIDDVKGEILSSEKLNNFADDARKSAIATLLNTLSHNFGFARLKKMIANTTALTHDWTDPTLFKKIKNICDFIGIDTIYAYTSNILAMIDKGLFDRDPRHPQVRNLLENVESLKPTASIFSNYDYALKRPSTIQCYTNACDNHERLADEMSIRTSILKYTQKMITEMENAFSQRDLLKAKKFALSAKDFLERLQEKNEHQQHLLGLITEKLAAIDKIIDLQQNMDLFSQLLSP